MPKYTIASHRTRQKSLEFVKQCFRVKAQFLCKKCVRLTISVVQFQEALQKSHLPTEGGSPFVKADGPRSLMLFRHSRISKSSSLDKTRNVEVFAVPAGPVRARMRYNPLRTRETADMFSFKWLITTDTYTVLSQFC